MTTYNGLGYTSVEMRRLFARINGALKPKDSDYVRENLEISEWGVALDHLVFLVERRKLPVDDGTRVAMYKLAERMNLDLPRRRQSWKKL